MFEMVCNTFNNTVEGICGVFKNRNNCEVYKY